ncbi:hypothetical protein BC941DRAFT_422255 [Chlamydoabsidia padenii]|nr:hypothetical protein BC941DRAFT_422255 [Chlamydoabsidia padenii]
MILSKQYTSPHLEEEQQNQHIMDSGTLHPSAQSHSSYQASRPFSNQRRGSAATGDYHSSSPPLPNLNRPSPLEHRPDLISTPPLHTPWRRDSLPSISQLTGELPGQERPPRHPVRTRHTSSPASLLLEDAQLRRHSIATLSHHHDTVTNRGSDPSSSSSTCSSPTLDCYSTPHSPPRRLSNAHMVAPYSRTPELRVSHRLAERKRRKQMKDLFDDLRDMLPVDKGLRTSKWEILSKAVGYISHLHERERNLTKETEDLKREIMTLKQQKQQQQ